MEQCRKAGKSHWYHETQSTMSSQPPLSLMPEAAYVNDRFLLDLTVSETALTPFESWLKPAVGGCLISPHGSQRPASYV